LNSGEAMGRENIKAQIVIIGGGGAGLSAALAAAEKGAQDIVVLEKRGVTGGNSAMAGGPFAAESPVQKRQAIIAPKDELFRIAMKWAHLKINPRIVRAYIDKSGDTIRWLEEKGLQFSCIKHSPIDNPLTWHVPKGGGAELMKVLARECEKRGIEIFTNTPAKKLLTDATNKIIGIIAEKDGKTFTLTTETAIIATGGYAGNKELLRKYYPYYHDGLRLSGLPNTGDGLTMATGIGAATDGLGIALVAGPIVGQRTPLILGNAPNVTRVGLTHLAGEPSMVWVNKLGRRFIDETVILNYYESINALVRQPDGLSYTLFDTEIIQNITENGLANVPDGEHAASLRGRLPPGLQKELALQANGGILKQADSWDEIAKWIGANPSVLRTTIDEYNSVCDHGYDPIFAKGRKYLVALRTAPYYAIRCTSSLLNTMGGIKINEHMEVLDELDNPIPGLFAAGIDTGGWISDTYCAILPGTAFGFALNSGRIAGENALKFLLVNK
jgi:fumarate reductase flavoprotein subunit